MVPMGDIILGGAACVSALIDRFVQRCHIVDIDADSWAPEGGAGDERAALRGAELFAGTAPVEPEEEALSGTRARRHGFAGERLEAKGDVVVPPARGTEVTHMPANAVRAGLIRAAEAP